MVGWYGWFLEFDFVRIKIESFTLLSLEEKKTGN